MRFRKYVKSWRIKMKSLINISLAVALVASSVVTAAAPAMAKTKHHQAEMACMSEGDVGAIIVVGALLGAVTGGVGSAIVYGGAYAVGGAAIGGGAGLLLGVVHHGHHHCA
jgi:hypothetical protein